MSSEQIEDIMSALNEMGVNIVENEEAGEDGDEPEEEAPRTRSRPSTRTTMRRPSIEKKKETIDRTDDPVRMYLREMGAVELLSREGEIAIAKRIEAGRDTMILGPVRKPDHLQRDHRLVERAQRRHDAAARDPRSRRDAVEGARPREALTDERRGATARSPKRPPARPSRKRKSPRRRPPTRTRTNR